MSKLEDKILQYIISGRASADKDIDKEIREDPSFDQADFDLLNKIWNDADLLRDYKRPSHDQAWQNIMQETGIGKVRSINHTRRWLAAASVVALLSLGLYFYLTNDPYISYIAQSDEEYTLPDNSKIGLKAGTEIRHLKADRFPSAANRHVYFDGEATFDIAQGEKPFKVIAEHTAIDVLGTKFMYKVEGVSAEAENMEGQVKFSTAKGDSVVLNQGDKVTYDGTTLNYIKYEPPPPPEPEPTGNNVTMDDLFDIIVYKFGGENVTSVSGLRLGRVVVNVDLKIDSLDEFIQALVDNPNIDIEATKRGSNRVHISRLQGTSTGLRPDFNYNMLLNGVRFK